MKYDIVSAQPHSELVGTALWRLESQYPTKDEANATDEADYRLPERSVTDRASRGASDPGTPLATRATRDAENYGIGRVRDLFLDALDQRNTRRSVEIARHLVACGNPLPTATCNELGLPAGSTYGAAARAVLNRAPGEPSQ